MPANPPISNELALASACCLAADGGLEWRESALDWDRFEHLVHYHGIAGLAGARLQEAMPGLLPEALARRLTLQLQQDTVLQMAHLSETVRLAALLEAGGVRVLVMKGVALACMLHPSYPERRPSCDIDLLVDPAALAEADRILRGAEYLREWPEDPFPGRGHGMVLRLANAFNYLHPRTGQLVELHHRMTLNPWCLPADFDELHGLAVPVETPLGPVHGLDGPLFYAYLCWHALGHFDFRLKWIADLAGMLGRTGEARGSAYAARDGRIARFPAIDLCDELLAALTGGACAGEPAEARWTADVTRILAGMEQARDNPPKRSLAALPSEMANLRFMRRLAPDRRSRWYELLRLLCDPRDAQVLGLGPEFSMVYGVLGPLLSAQRGLYRLRKGRGQTGA